METYDLLKEDLIQTAIRHHTREEAEVLAGRVTDLIVEMVEKIVIEAMDEHDQRFEHTYREEY